MNLFVKSRFCLNAFALLFTIATDTARAEEYLTYKRQLLTRLDPNKPEHKEFQNAYKLFGQSYYRGAQVAFQNGNGKYPNSALFEFGMASICFAREEKDKALTFVNSSLKKDPKFVDAIKLRGIIYSAQEKPGMALKEFTYLASACPSAPIVYRLKGMAELECNRFSQAKMDLDNGLKLAPKDPDLLFLKASILYWDGNYKEALAAINQALPFSHDEPYLLRSKIYVHLNKFDEAKADIKSAAATTKYSYASKSRRVDDYKYDRENAETDPAKAWALACAAPLFTQNHNGLRSLSGVIPNQRNIEEEKKLLIEWWGIHDRQQLIETVNSQTRNGHNRSWFDIKAQLESPLSFLANTFSPERARVVKKYKAQLGSRGLRAWDSSRTIAICRWGYRCGFLTKEEAFEMIMPQAKLIQQTYSSWKQFAEEYYIGRLFWDEKIYLEDKTRTELNVHQLLNDPNSPWRRLDWNTPLGNGAA